MVDVIREDDHPLPPVHVQFGHHRSYACDLHDPMTDQLQITNDLAARVAVKRQRNAGQVLQVCHDTSLYLTHRSTAERAARAPSTSPQTRLLFCGTTLATIATGKVTPKASP